MRRGLPLYPPDRRGQGAAAIPQRDGVASGSPNQSQMYRAGGDLLPRLARGQSRII